MTEERQHEDSANQVCTTPKEAGCNIRHHAQTSVKDALDLGSPPVFGVHALRPVPVLAGLARDVELVFGRCVDCQAGKAFLQTVSSGMSACAFMSGRGMNTCKHMRTCNRQRDMSACMVRGKFVYWIM